jgi:hypothetical protein
MQQTEGPEILRMNAFPWSRCYVLITMFMPFLLAGCTTSALDLPDSKRFPAPTATVITSPEPVQPVLASGPSTTGQYPSFSRPLRAASVQMSDEAARDLQQQLTSLASQRTSGAISEAEYLARVADLRKLAEDHGPDTVKEIEK